MLMRKIVLLLGVLLFVPSISYADKWCTGKVKYTGVSKHGVVFVNGPGGMPSVYLCNIVNQENAVKVEACKHMYATLLAAKAAEKNVSITFTPEPSSCSSFTGWVYAPGVNWVFSEVSQ